MKILSDNFKYVGKSNKIIKTGNEPWHCTRFIKDLSTGEMKYCMQQPVYENGKFIGHQELNAYALTINELARNFKVIKQDGTLEDIKPNKDKKLLNKELKKIKDDIDKMSEEELDKLFVETLDKLI